MKRKLKPEEMPITPETKGLVKELANLRIIANFSVWEALNLQFRNTETNADIPELIQRNNFLEPGLLEVKRQLRVVEVTL